MAMNTPGMPMDTCIPQELTINNVELARAYVPFQKFCNTYAPQTALSKGTAFPAIFAVSGWDESGRRLRDDD